jgi:hypothetical protein
MSIILYWRINSLFMTVIFGLTSLEDPHQFTNEWLTALLPLHLISKEGIIQLIQVRLAFCQDVYAKITTYEQSLPNSVCARLQYKGPNIIHQVYYHEYFVHHVKITQDHKVDIYSGYPCYCLSFLQEQVASNEKYHVWFSNFHSIFLIQQVIIHVCHHQVRSHNQHYREYRILAQKLKIWSPYVSYNSIDVV